VSRIQFTHSYEHIISIENLLEAWKGFLKGKRNKKGVKEFQRFLMKNIYLLHEDLQRSTYIHAGYHAFKISDPKPRDIHKATVRDRLLHHALYRVLYPFFDNTFIADSYSCRRGKGTHKAMDRFKGFARKVSKNNTRGCFVLKCDIRKFFASIDHEILREILFKYIVDKKVLSLLDNVIESFNSRIEGKGLPLGNLTSQLFVNIYMNEFDQYVKHTLKAKYYIRYADDFVILSQNKDELDEIYRLIGIFLNQRLKLELHPDKCSIKTIASGVDFLGWVHFPTPRVLRTVAKKRMFKRIRETDCVEQTLPSHLGLLSHGDTWKLRKQISKQNTFS
jgi:RNA-directed DNA polymerase